MSAQHDQPQSDHATLVAWLEDSRARAVEPWTGVLASVVQALAASNAHYDWTGIYLLDGDELVLGPFVGEPTEHVRIPIGRGICGAAVAERDTIIVDDVNADPRYLACFVSTRSEIVVPIITTDGRVIGEIDIDSEEPAAFGDEDRRRLERVAALLAALAPAADSAAGEWAPDERAWSAAETADGSRQSSPATESGEAE